FFRSIINRIISLGFGFSALGQDSSDGRSQSGFSVVDVTNGTDVNVGLATIKLFCHLSYLSSRKTGLPEISLSPSPIDKRRWTEEISFFPPPAGGLNGIQGNLIITFID